MNVQQSLINNPFTVFVEGNVGSGKSTFLDSFKSFDDVQVLEEPIDKWKNLHGHNLFDLRFKLPELFAFPFQSYATLTRLRQHLQPTEKPIKVMERSLLTARHCFVKNLHQNGMHDGLYHVLNEWYDFVNDFHTIRCDLIVYLRTTPETASTRIRARARTEETTINDLYINQLHDRHEELLVRKNNLIATPVLIIDANQSLEEMIVECQRCYEIIQQMFIARKLKPDDPETTIRI